MDAYKIYSSKPAWAIDLEIYVGSNYYPVTDWTEAQIEDYASRIRDALTANGNFAYVSWEESTISIFADPNGDNARFFNLIDEGCNHGASLYTADGYELRQPGAEWEEFQKSLGL